MIGHNWLIIEAVSEVAGHRRGAVCLKFVLGDTSGIGESMRPPFPILGWLLWAFVQGCGVDLSDVEVTGGTVEQRRAVQSYVDEFAGWTSTDTRIPKLKITEVGRNASGIYNATNHVVRIHPDYTDDESVTFHELCHAVERQSKFADPMRSMLERHPAWILQEVRPHHPWRESYAQYCEKGPRLTGPVSLVHCGELGHEVYSRVHGQVYEDAAEVSLLDLEWRETGRWRLQTGWSDGDLVGLRYVEDVGLLIQVEHPVDGSFQFGTFDLWTGKPTGMALPFSTEEVDAVVLPWTTYRGVAHDNGTVFMGFSSLADGESARRMMQRAEDGALGVFSHCPNRSETPFTAEGGIWSGRIEGAAVVWGPWQ